MCDFTQKEERVKQLKKKKEQNSVDPLEVLGVFQFEPQSFKIGSLSP
jgi:hypothetical protein